MRRPRLAARRLRLLFVLPLLPAAGCTYLENRLVDLGDSFLWRWHQDALGVCVDAKVGPLDVAVGGWYAEFGQGKDTWWQTPGFVLTNHGTGIPFTTLSPIAYGTSWSRVLATHTWGDHPAAPAAFDDVRSWICVSDVFDLDDASPYRLTTARRISDLFGVEVGVVPVFVGLHVGVNVAELADCLLGFVGLDVFGDDGAKRPPTMPYVPAVPRTPGEPRRPGA